MIGIIDYGMGNIHSVKKALELQGASVSVVRTAQQLLTCAKAVLPGVGAFGDAMKNLNRTGLTSAVKEFVSSGRPFLGICLGMHLLFSRSAESPGIKGLALLKGSVQRFPRRGLKVPHMGWNTVKRKRECFLLKGIPEASVYFCHSFYPSVTGSNAINAGITRYGEVSFPSVVCAGNISAVQFHPEKSQKDGLRMLKNFVSQT